ncbi:hypothetical protein M0811_12566 [Anaeramoeba ignava]|uniref:Uncharacterized protein n=1 Tax=Anaeramoeba ignava TaxID=1746090 RepID=A0A9Q0L823_ANAIG|nr:hypothetical protein M0811_12566 [Anaeramoeba ignava]
MILNIDNDIDFGFDLDFDNDIEEKELFNSNQLIGKRLDILAKIRPDLIKGWKSSTFKCFKKKGIIPEKVIIHDDGFHFMAQCLEITNFEELNNPTQEMKLKYQKFIKNYKRSLQKFLQNTMKMKRIKTNGKQHQPIIFIKK